MARGGKGLGMGVIIGGTFLIGAAVGYFVGPTIVNMINGNTTAFARLGDSHGYGTRSQAYYTKRWKSRWEDRSGLDPNTDQVFGGRITIS